MSEPAPATEDLAPRRRRRRWPWVIAVVLVVLVVAAVVGDRAARAYAEDRVRSEVVAQFGLDSADEVTVDLGDGSILWQAIRGRIDSVELTAPDAVFGDLSGDLELAATGVPLDPAADVGTLRVDFAIPESEAERLATSLSGVDLDSVVFDEPEVSVTASLSVLFLTLPVSMSLEPSTDGGRLVFTPTRVTAADREISADDLRSGPLGSLAERFLTQQSICIDQALPSNLGLSSASIAGKDLVLRFDGDGQPLSSPGKGQCS